MKTPALLFALAWLSVAAAHGQGTIRSTTCLLPDGTNMTTVTNPDTRTRQETIRDRTGKVLRTTLYTINAENFTTGAIHYADALMKVVRYKEVYTFDATGRITEAKLYSKDNQPIGRRVFVFEGKDQARIEDYDAAGNLITPGAQGAPPEVRRAVPVQH